MINKAGKIEQIAKRVEKRSADLFAEIDATARINTEKVLRAMRCLKVSDNDFRTTTGYGYGDQGRDKLEKLFAGVMGGEAALVRGQIASGTHALACSLFGLLRPGDHLLSITGKPYNTLHPVIGLDGSSGTGSLRDWGIEYSEVGLLRDGVNIAAVTGAIRNNTKVVLIQRSRGYRFDRPSLSLAAVDRAISAVRALKADCWCLVDNCYCEFVEDGEPPAVGADVCAGSLIKNPGGGLAPCGGYIVGRYELVEKIAGRLVAPGIGRGVGCTSLDNRLLFQGLFIASHVTAQALKSAILAAGLMEELGFAVSPAPQERRTDIVQAIRFGTADKMIGFCQAIQSWSPVDSFLTIEPAFLPGYGVPVVMAAGTFVQGASIELSADGPVEPPYVAYLQGALIYEHARLALIAAAAAVAP
ncbi:MAG: methionine gamma-lyase family protein [Negativicutes bacterium]|nr:methionine gamma-lyase family protein [Negativicutes bacterium]